jgi:hypothetical protein
MRQNSNGDRPPEKAKDAGPGGKLKVEMLRAKKWAKPLKR